MGIAKQTIWTLFQRRWKTWAFVTGGSLGLVAALYHLQPARYRAVGIFQPETSERSPLKPAQDPDRLDVLLARFFFRRTTVTPEAQLITSDSLLKQTIQRQNLTDGQGNLISPRQLRDQLVLRAIAPGDQVQLAYVSPNPQQAAEVVNTTLQLYMQQIEPESLAASMSFTRFVQPYLVESEMLLKQSQQALYQIQANTQQPSSSTVGEQSDLLQSFQANVDRQASTIAEDLGQLQRQQGIVSDSQQQILSDLVNLTQTRQQILEQLQDLLGRSSSSQSISALIPPLEQQTLNLQKLLILATQRYQAFLANQQGPVVLDQPALTAPTIVQLATVPNQPFRPYTPLWFGGGGLFSVTLGFIAVWWRDRSDRSFRSLGDLYQAAHIPILGIIPHSARTTFRSLTHAPFSPKPSSQPPQFQQTFTALLTSLQQAGGSGGMPQVLTFTKMERNVGQTALLAQLAQALTVQGRKILLLDADFGLEASKSPWSSFPGPGLGDYLEAQISLGKALQRVQPNLDLLTCGQAHQNWDMLLNSPGMSLLMEELRSRYDHILVDAPPLSESAHGYLMADTSDAIVLVLRGTGIKQDHIPQAKAILERAGRLCRGMILTDAPYLDQAPAHTRIIRQSQWDLPLRIQKDRSSSPAILSTFAALARSPHPENPLDSDHSLEKLYHLPLATLKQAIAARWQRWSSQLSLVLEEEQEVIEQRQQVQSLQRALKEGNAYTRLQTEMQLKEETEKLTLLTATFMGQRPHLIAEQEILRKYLGILYARVAAEQISSASDRRELR
ncbi:hypothetical protein [Lyngbya confervoides]|uniref:AAA domain-containing protein n=1 Tax=Lyngbya confervoides BDU141951 TaxID=1574623 RepID=A0ABD4T4H2_9CYAN|nr:hypothetical protein [Lyngbya confervoides]MCM1983551.1 hypothetical protein [Lyngbya confervoides BDU141951]